MMMLILLMMLPILIGRLLAVPEQNKLVFQLCLMNIITLHLLSW
jgi:hypothetical protein